ncbi:CGNR zinc finger domain-containing protein [Streptomyces sp. NPDC051940]|uniref:CGNR zinc finger domain-containing protein n=1 Tax=Streptomyces sp. NPDC051940 TaxID=3155675 RepID=UPI00343C9A3D
MSTTDPRPLTDEPLAIDLLNTRWMRDGEVQDLLTSPTGLAAWLASPGVASQLAGLSVRADAATLDAVLQVRAALYRLVDHPEDTGGRSALNKVLAHGHVRHELGPDAPVTRVETDDPVWLPAWTAAESYLRLLDDRPERIRACSGPTCILHFYDTSKNGTRRWCSMAACGNRAKARSHYARSKQG